MAKESRNKVFDPLTFDEERLTCSHCHWNGRGDEAIVIDLYNITAGKEVRCPKCDSLLGILPAEKNNLGNSSDQLGFQIG